ncbi:unnamed protein product, partial [Musa banksii]
SVDGSVVNQNSAGCLRLTKWEGVMIGSVVLLFNSSSSSLCGQLKLAQHKGNVTAVVGDLTRGGGGGGDGCGRH